MWCMQMRTSYFCKVLEWSPVLKNRICEPLRCMFRKLRNRLSISTNIFQCFTSVNVFEIFVWFSWCCCCCLSNQQRQASMFESFDLRFQSWFWRIQRCCSQIFFNGDLRNMWPRCSWNWFGVVASICKNCQFKFLGMVFEYLSVMPNALWRSSPISKFRRSPTMLNMSINLQLCSCFICTDYDVMGH